MGERLARHRAVFLRLVMTRQLLRRHVTKQRLTGIDEMVKRGLDFWCHWSINQLGSFLRCSLPAAT